MIRLFEKQLNAKQEEEIKKLLTDYFAKQIDQEMEQIWEEKRLSQEELDRALEEHKRTHLGHPVLPLEPHSGSG